MTANVGRNPLLRIVSMVLILASYIACLIEPPTFMRPVQIGRREADVLQSIVAGDSRFIASGIGSSVLKVSSDGLSWSSASLPGDYFLCNSIADGHPIQATNLGFMALVKKRSTDSSVDVLISQDSIQWILLLSLPDAIINPKSFCYYDHKMLVINYDSSLYYSNNLSDWKKMADPEIKNMHSCRVMEGLWMINTNYRLYNLISGHSLSLLAPNTCVGEDSPSSFDRLFIINDTCIVVSQGYIYITRDFSSWSKINNSGMPSNKYFSDLTSYSGRYVAICPPTAEYSRPSFFYSDNLVSWASGILKAYPSFKGSGDVLVSNNNGCVAGGGDNLYYSRDGITWTVEYERRKVHD